MAVLQLAMLRNAAALLRPGGAMVYSVCSLMPEEGPRRRSRSFSRKIRATKSTRILRA